MNDIEKRFQKEPFLRSAPYFDLPTFIEALKRRLLVNISGPWHTFHPEFVQDLQDYCDGKLLYVPKDPCINRAITRALRDAFPVSRNDPMLSKASELIWIYICTPRQWSASSRGDNVSLEDSDST